jgi:polyisoprenoid-binding protein YceI
MVDKIHSEIGFKVKHLMIASVKGSFQSFDAVIITPGKDFSRAEIQVAIEADSVHTGDRERDEHLTSADFLDVINHRYILFTSDKIVRCRQKGEYLLLGTLTILGESRSIELKIKFGGILQDPWGNEKAGFQVTGKINRQDWGLTWNTLLQTGGFLIGDTVTILCEFELINATARARVRGEEYMMK